MKRFFDDLADLYRCKLKLPNAVFTHIDHEDAMVATVFKISQPGKPDLILILKVCKASLKRAKASAGFGVEMFLRSALTSSISLKNFRKTSLADSKLSFFKFFPHRLNRSQISFGHLQWPYAAFLEALFWRGAQ